MDRPCSTIPRRHAAAVLLLALCAAMLPATLPQAAGAPDTLAGTWLTDDGDSKVEIAPARAADGSTASNGKVVWLKSPTRDGQPLRDTNNADPSLRSRPILGLEMVSGFRADGSGGWTGGTVYSPRAGKRYPAEATLDADGRLQIKVRAGLVTRTVTWTR